ncbi:MAG: HD domain-containing protein [Spirochaetales bacterium]|nr:HD domain-containing protein [Spirochaetales bacterium]
MTVSDSDKLKLLIDLDADINKIQDVDILLEEILHGARQAASADAGSIYLVEDGRLHIRYSQNETLQRRLPEGQKLAYSIFSIPINNQTIAGYVASSGELLNIPDAYSLSPDLPFHFDPKYDVMTEYRTVSMLTLPLKVNTGKVIGVIQIINAKAPDGLIRAFSPDDELLVLHYAGSATMALQRAQLTRTIILRMIKMAEFRDPKETGPHVNRVAGYATELYRRWAVKKGQPSESINRTADIFKMAAMLHDVGKVGISDLILKKPAKFTPEEYQIMQTHTVLGASLFLDRQSEFDAMAAEVAMTHHENWDGTGYPGWVDPLTGEPTKMDEEGKPLKRKGEEIPIWGRIVAVADVYDALSCRRVYKEAWDEKDVLEEMRKMSAIKFDPELIEVFFEALPAIKQITQRYPD